MKYKIAFQISLEIEAEHDEEAQSAAHAELKELLKNKKVGITSLTLHRLKERTNFSVVIPQEDIYPYLTKEPFARDYIINDIAYSVDMSKIRYRLFRDNARCVVCGLEGTEWRLEYNCYSQRQFQDIKVSQPQLNLYAYENGRKVLMNKDHIHPKSSGGLSNLNNLQTMCLTCNDLKGNSELLLPSDILHLRNFYNEHKKSLSKPTFAEVMRKEKQKIINKCKQQLAAKHSPIINEAQQKMVQPTLTTTCDLDIFQGTGNFCIPSRQTPRNIDAIFIGMIPAQSKVIPYGRRKRNIQVQYHYLKLSIYMGHLE